MSAPATTPVAQEARPQMSFDKLLEKVEQAENAVEARERQVAADWRQLKRSWRASWTPGRIVVAGLASGFLVGRIEPGKAVASGGGVLRMVASLGALLASTQAQAAAGEAEQAAETAGDTAESAAVAAGVHPPTATAEAFEP